MPRIQVVISDEQRDRWDSYADESPEIDDRSDLIRKAVEQFISTSGQEQSTLNDDAMHEALTRLETLNATADRIEAKTTLAKDQQLDKDDIAQVVHNEFRSWYPALVDEVERALDPDQDRWFEQTGEPAPFVGRKHYDE